MNNISIILISNLQKPTSPQPSCADSNTPGRLQTALKPPPPPPPPTRSQNLVELLEGAMAIRKPFYRESSVYNFPESQGDHGFSTSEDDEQHEEQEDE